MNPDKFEFRNPKGIKPPGCKTQILSRPIKDGKSIELGIFQEHRYAFYYWLKWTQVNDQPPCLVTLDWHRDLYAPDAQEKEWLSELNKDDLGEVSFHCWAKLAGNNDNHILSAAYLNLIGNIYVHCKQGFGIKTVETSKFIDYYGNIHQIKYYKEFDDLETALLKSREESVYFDIDLDFFTIENSSNSDKRFTYLTTQEIEELLSFDRPLIYWIFERLEGMTIATEPECTGGLLKSNKFLELINNTYFSPELFTMGCNWKWKNRL